jgi:acyl-lipid omega-6 desaturase (Delta-12 desaturase)
VDKFRKRGPANCQQALFVSSPYGEKRHNGRERQARRRYIDARHHSDVPLSRGRARSAAAVTESEDEAGVTDWQAAVAPHVGPQTRRSILQLTSTLGLLGFGLALSYFSLGWSLWITLALALPIAGLLVRTFIIMHDCAHGSFLPWRRANDLVGFVTGVLTLTPFGQWRRDHALHHASSGDLGRRGHGDIPTLTVREYLARGRWGRLTYRLIRHPLSLMLVGPLHLIVSQRFRPRGRATGNKQVFSVGMTNVAIALTAAAAVLWLGWSALLLVYLPAFYLAAMTGVWLFYVQHQFEDAYWESRPEWDYATAALRGSSHLVLPPVLQWFTGSIGLHHVHHLAPRIPNYRLQTCLDSTRLLQHAPIVTIRSGIASLRLALWDEDQRRMVRFGDVRAGAHILAVDSTTAISRIPRSQ